MRHTVVAGDTLSYIARIYAVTIAELVDLNGISNPDLIFPGQVLDIPGSRDGGSNPITGGERSVYEVQPGDTLSSISGRFGVPVEALQIANGLAEPDFIVVGQHLVIPSPPDADMPPSQLATPPASPEIEAIIDELSAAGGVDAGLVKAIAWVESRWEQEAVSPNGATGVMQLMPETAAWLEAEAFGHELNEQTSVYDNVKAGVRLLRILLDATGDTDLAIASYYQGYGTILNGTLYEDTLGYVRSVQAIKERFWP